MSKRQAEKTVDQLKAEIKAISKWRRIEIVSQATFIESVAAGTEAEQDPHRSEGLPTDVVPTEDDGTGLEEPPEVEGRTYGAGCYGIVMKAVYNGELTAIKIFKTDFDDPTACLRDMLQELEMLLLDDGRTCMVGVRALFLGGGGYTPAIFFERVDNSLSVWLKMREGIGGKLVLFGAPWWKAQADLLYRFVKLAELGIRHNDFKLSNVLVCAYGNEIQTRVGDPGLAHPFSEQPLERIGNDWAQGPELDVEGRLCENSDMLGLGRAMFATLFHAGPSQAAYQQWHVSSCALAEAMLALLASGKCFMPLGDAARGLQATCIVHQSMVRLLLLAYALAMRASPRQRCTVQVAYRLVSVACEVLCASLRPTSELPTPALLELAQRALCVVVEEKVIEYVPISVRAMFADRHAHLGQLIRSMRQLSAEPGTGAAAAARCPAAGAVKFEIVKATGLPKLLVDKSFSVLAVSGPEVAADERYAWVAEDWFPGFQIDRLALYRNPQTLLSFWTCTKRPPTIDSLSTEADTWLGALVERGIAQRYASAAGPRKAAALRRLIAALGKGVLKAAAGSNGYGAPPTVDLKGLRELSPQATEEDVEALALLGHTAFQLVTARVLRVLRPPGQLRLEYGPTSAPEIVLGACMAITEQGDRLVQLVQGKPRAAEHRDLPSQADLFICLAALGTCRLQQRLASSVLERVADQQSIRLDECHRRVGIACAAAMQALQPHLAAAAPPATSGLDRLFAAINTAAKAAAAAHPSAAVPAPLLEQAPQPALQAAAAQQHAAGQPQAGAGHLQSLFGQLQPAAQPQPACQPQAGAGHLQSLFGQLQPAAQPQPACQPQAGAGHLQSLFGQLQPAAQPQPACQPQAGAGPLQSLFAQLQPAVVQQQQAPSLTERSPAVTPSPAAYAVPQPAPALVTSAALAAAAAAAGAQATMAAPRSAALPPMPQPSALAAAATAGKPSGALAFLGASAMAASRQADPVCNAPTVQALQGLRMGFLGGSAGGGWAPLPSFFTAPPAPMAPAAALAALVRAPTERSVIVASALAGSYGSASTESGELAQAAGVPPSADPAFEFPSVFNRFANLGMSSRGAGAPLSAAPPASRPPRAPASGRRRLREEAGGEEAASSKRSRVGGAPDPSDDALMEASSQRRAVQRIAVAHISEVAAMAVVVPYKGLVRLVQGTHRFASMALLLLLPGEALVNRPLSARIFQNNLVALTNAVRDGLLEAFLNPFNQQALAQSQGVTAEQLTDLTKHGVCLLEVIEVDLPGLLLGIPEAARVALPRLVWRRQFAGDGMSATEAAAAAAAGTLAPVKRPKLMAYGRCDRLAGLPVPDVCAARRALLEYMVANGGALPPAAAAGGTVSVRLRLDAQLPAVPAGCYRWHEQQITLP